MYWIIQDNKFREEGYQRLLDTLARFNIHHSVHKVVPFAGILEPEITPPPGRVIIMGSYTLAKLAKERGWFPGSFMGPDLDFEVQLKHWGDIMLNASACIYTFGDVPEQPQPFFLRPTLDSKSFAGRVMDWSEFTEWRNSVLRLTPEDNATVTRDTRVMVCPKREIWTETRFWIIDGKVVTASIYKLGTRVTYQEVVDHDLVYQLADSIAHRDGMTPGDACTVCGPQCRWQPERAYCLDIANTPDGPKIIEVNNLNSAGFYAADVSRLVYEIERMYFQQEST